MQSVRIFFNLSGLPLKVFFDFSSKYFLLTHRKLSWGVSVTNYPFWRSLALAWKCGFFIKSCSCESLGQPGGHQAKRPIGSLSVGRWEVSRSALCLFFGNQGCVICVGHCEAYRMGCAWRVSSRSSGSSTQRLEEAHERGGQLPLYQIPINLIENY